ncbi:CHAP domain-containing protein [Candidatus Solirubrobacter pratensis]|uniref:CHAP domain-containing protein n=1 Tax=Candidatus Solirubrobacter pratensis TaxID=1298857 RepID=UPI00041FCEE1|nr:CHAP domain-containing protein [Candidatus Solirubrobacter pratensis]
MSVDAVIARVAHLSSLLAPQPVAAPAATAVSTPLATGAGASFAGLMGQAAGTAAPAAAPAAGGTPAGQAMVDLASREVGVAEQPPGSNDSPRIAQYRQATAGSGVGPWCGYFVSWAARNAGVPLGDQGQGFGAVSDVWAWAERSGKAIQPGTGPSGAPTQPPQAGDLIVWGGRHIGLVESVDANGSIHTIEGNSSNQVSRRTYGPDGGGATGFVRLG